MSVCINTYDPKYIHLKKIIDDKSLKFLNYYALKYLEEKGRLPRLDEIPGATSLDFFKKAINAKKIDQDVYSTTKENILQYTNKDNIDDARISINNYLHPDLEVDIVDCGESSIVEAHQRPRVSNVITDIIDFDENVNPEKNKIIVREMLYKLGKLYGIKFIPITTDELKQKKWDVLIPNSSFINAFVYNGDIYINTDNAKIDAPIHELSHVFIGSLRFINPQLYLQLINSIESLPMYTRISQEFPGRTRNDVNEEIFVTETAKYLSGQQSLITELSDTQIDEIIYNMHRVLDSMLNGQISVKCIPQQKVINSALITLGKTVMSPAFNNQTMLDIDLSYVHRVLNNTKADLIRNNKLIEECN